MDAPRLSNAYEEEFAKVVRCAMEAELARDGYLCFFWPVVGTGYEPGRGILFIGRAPNGWRGKDEWYRRMDWEGTEAEIAEQARLSAEKLDGDRREALAWVTKPPPSKYDYHPNRSQFWKAILGVTSKRLGLALDPTASLDQDRDWVQKIAWSNLYKVAPACGGNPPAPLLDKVREGCMELLRLEIEELRPGTVVFLAGWSWAEPFVTELAKSLNVEGKLCSGGAHVSWVGRQGGCPWVVADHPQGRKREGFVDEVVAAFEGR